MSVLSEWNDVAGLPAGCLRNRGSPTMFRARFCQARDLPCCDHDSPQNLPEPCISGSDTLPGWDVLCPVLGDYLGGLDPRGSRGGSRELGNRHVGRLGRSPQPSTDRERSAVVAAERLVLDAIEGDPALR